MKPTDPTDILNWEATNITTPEEEKIIKERMAKAWLKKRNQ